MSGALFGHSCDGCEAIVKEMWAKEKTRFRCNAPGPFKGYIVGTKRFMPYIPAWCPKLKEKGDDTE